MTEDSGARKADNGVEYRRGQRDAFIDAALENYERRMSRMEQAHVALDESLDRLSFAVTRLEEAAKLALTRQRQVSEKQITARQFYLGLAGFLVALSTLLVSILAAVGGIH